MSSLRSLLRCLAFIVFASTTGAQIPSLLQPYDAVKYFCQRWYHQSVVKSDTLFIHGGIQTYNLPEQANWTNNTLGYNPFLLQVDLRKWWDWKTNMSFIALEEKPNLEIGLKVRDAMISGAMFHGPYNETSIYTYGGTTFRGNESFPNNDTHFQYSENDLLWSFDNATQVWKPYDTEQPTTPNYGAAAEAPDQGLAFYLNGKTDNGTAPSTLNVGDHESPLDGMVVIDVVQHTARNLSTSGMRVYQPRIGGALQYVGRVGAKGVLVALGGKVYNGKTTPTSIKQGRLRDFDAVDVFDIESLYKNAPRDANGTWYSQPTSGDIPPPRIDFCTIITSAPDNSSHNIWLHAGKDPTTDINGTTYYDDVYVLSLPSFTWIKVYQGEKPKWGHTCHLAGGNQMLAVGGHNMFPNTCDWHTTGGIGVLDLSKVIWGSIFQASGNNPGLSYKIVDKIGGSPSGGATKTMPDKGWASDEFGKIMGTKRIYDNFRGTIDVKLPQTIRSSTKMRIAIAAGAGVGGAILVASISWLVLYWKRGRSARSTESSRILSTEEIEGTCKVELPGDSRLCEATGIDCRHESPCAPVKAEADSSNGVTYTAELPTTNFGQEGRWGIPIIQTQSPNASIYTNKQRWTGYEY